MPNATCIKPFKGVLICLLLILWLNPGVLCAAVDLAGDWEMLMVFNETKSYHTITIQAKEGGGHDVRWSNSEITDVNFEGGKLSFVRTVQFGDNAIANTYTGTLKEGVFKGVLSNDWGEFPTKMARVKPAYPCQGVWDLNYRVGEREITGQLTVSRNIDGSLTGQWQAAQGEHVVYDVAYQDGKLSFTRKSKYNDFEFEIEYRGTIQDDRLQGKFTSDRGDIEANGQRKGTAFVGEWILDTEAPWGPRTRHLVVTPDLQPRYELFDGLMEGQDLKIEGQQLSFMLVSSWGENTMEIKFTATLDEGVLKGQFSSDRGDIAFTGKRKPAP